jgi:hypothetical protein
MEGNVWENSTGVRKDVRGDEEVEDVGDGGPRAEGETKEWAGRVWFDIFDDADALWLMGGDNKESDCREFLIVRVPSEDVVVGESGTAGVEGSSLETRLLVLTDKPASCNDRIRSAMLPPDSFATPFSDGGERWPLSLASTCKEDIRGWRWKADLLRGSGSLDLNQFIFYDVCTLRKVAALSLKSIKKMTEGVKTMGCHSPAGIR